MKDTRRHLPASGGRLGMSTGVVATANAPCANRRPGSDFKSELSSPRIRAEKIASSGERKRIRNSVHIAESTVVRVHPRRHKVRIIAQ